LTPEVENEELSEEARALHRVFFPFDPPPEVVERYVAANRLCFGEAANSAMLRQIVRLRLDAEAVELALRYRRGNSILAKKIQILFYLLEVRSAYYARFAGEAESRPRAVAALALSIMQTFAKLLKGIYLVYRHGFV
jgi:hypothetical protein